MSTEVIREYYDELATRYDENRFGNTYGRYIHSQEEAFLKKQLLGKEILSVACGTGRFMELAQTGFDISEEMIAVAQSKFPEKKFHSGDASRMDFEDASFDAAFSMHLFMHLSKEKAKSIYDEVNRILVPGGKFIFDFPSAKRRNFLRKKRSDWHASTSYSIKELKELAGNKWELTVYSGTLFLPVHRIPKKLRKFFIRLDNLLCRSPFREYASHLVVVLEKK